MPHPMSHDPTSRPHRPSLGDSVSHPLPPPGLLRQVIELRLQGLTYAQVGGKLSLNQSQVHRLIAKHRPDLTGAEHGKLRNREIIRLRQERKSYAEIATR